MGFRFKRFDYVGGVAPWTGGTDTTSQVTRSQAVCKDFADFIIACGKGWQLDTSRNATTSDFVSVPIWNKSGTVQSFSAPGLFFTNTVSGCKLFLCVAGFNSYYGIALDNQYLLNEYTTTDRILQNGIILSMIPGGSNNDFGSSFDSSFLPSDATQITGSSWSASPSYDVGINYIAYNGSGNNYLYGLFVDSHCVGLGADYTTDGSVPSLNLAYFAGRVVGTLAHESDTLPQARYGVLRFQSNAGASGSNNTQDEVYYNYYSTTETVSSFGAVFNASVNITTSTPTTIRRTFGGALFAADGTRRDGRNSANVRYYPHTAFALASNSIMTNASALGAMRWVPFEFGVVSGDLATNGVVPGDGFKGYLDTELFRRANVTFNQLYNNGTFICASDAYGMLIGWDPTNTDSL